MRIIVAGVGRAGGSFAIAAHRAGHDLVGLLARDPNRAPLASLVSAPFLPWDRDLPPADFLLVAVSDDAIREVADRLAPVCGRVRAAVHLSGVTPVTALSPLAGAGLEVGGFHPLQTLPDALRGADALAGAHAGVTAPAALVPALEQLAISLGMRTFPLRDDMRAVYHAAAAAASNYVVSVLAIAAKLFDTAEVPLDVARPLVDAVVANVFDLGPDRALTGPIARGDVATVRNQLAAVAASVPEAAEPFRSLGRLTAELAGSDEVMCEVLE